MLIAEQYDYLPIMLLKKLLIDKTFRNCFIT